MVARFDIQQIPYTTLSFLTTDGLCTTPGSFFSFRYDHLAVLGLSDQECEKRELYKLRGSIGMVGRRTWPKFAQVVVVVVVSILSWVGELLCETSSLISTAKYVLGLIIAKWIFVKVIRELTACFVIIFFFNEINSETGGSRTDDGPSSVFDVIFS